jgi:glutamyl/glutaminyl-tRNA synthetase
VDDADFGITHVYRGNDHRPNEDLHRRLHEALGTTPPEYVHHGLILGSDGKKLSKRAAGATVARSRDSAFRPARCAPTSRSSACRATTSTTTCAARRLAIDAIGR